jgi:hypothetical protein
MSGVSDKAERIFAFRDEHMPRILAQRPRKVTGRLDLRGDPCAALLASNIDAFLRSVEAGDDLTPYMSLQSHTRGYTPAS